MLRFQRSKGFSMTSFLVVMALVIVVGILAMKIVPMYMEFNSVKSSMNALASDKFDSSKAVREALGKRMSINYVNSVQKDDITIAPEDGSYRVNVDYYVDKPLVYNLTISGHFEYSVLTSK